MIKDYVVVQRQDGFYVQRPDGSEDGPHATWLLARNRAYELQREEAES